MVGVQDFCTNVYVVYLLYRERVLMFEPHSKFKILFVFFLAAKAVGSFILCC